jgi:hypothetical protein
MRDGKLSGVLHVLLHMSRHTAEHSAETVPQTSEALAKVMDTNPVVVRRLMAGLREQGYVRDIYTALGSPPLLAIGHRAEAPGCLVEAAVNAALGKSFEEAEALLLSRLGDVTLAMLSEDVRARQAARGRHSENAHAHAPRSTAKHR